MVPAEVVFAKVGARVGLTEAAEEVATAETVPAFSPKILLEEARNVSFPLLDLKLRIEKTVAPVRITPIRKAG